MWLGHVPQCLAETGQMPGSLLSNQSQVHVFLTRLVNSSLARRSGHWRRLHQACEPQRSTIRCNPFDTAANDGHCARVPICCGVQAKFFPGHRRHPGMPQVGLESLSRTGKKMQSTAMSPRENYYISTVYRRRTFSAQSGALENTRPRERRNPASPPFRQSGAFRKEARKYWGFWTL